MSEFERWETRFTPPSYLFGTEPNAFLKSQAHNLKRGWKALSVADGEGRNGVWLAEQGLDVRTFDFSAKAVAKARELAKQGGVNLKMEIADFFPYLVYRPEMMGGDKFFKGIRGRHGRSRTCFSVEAVSTQELLASRPSPASLKIFAASGSF